MSIYYALQPEWADITPIPQDDGPSPLVPIMYNTDYSEAMSYLRAVMAKEEHSERVLELTLKCIKFNPSHYTVWQYRFETLLALQADLNEELELMNTFANENMKTYQVWHHRLLLLTHISPASPLSELEFISDSLIPDQKNYHTWAYRQWVLSHFGDRMSVSEWDDELAWTEKLLQVHSEDDDDDDAWKDVKQKKIQVLDESDDSDEDEDRTEHGGDVRNNSAWNHRFFLTFGRPGALGVAAKDRELKYTMSQLEIVPNNASAWAYLRGLHKKLSLPFAPLKSWSESLTLNKQKPCSAAIEWLADVAIEEGDVEAANQYFEQLKTLDPIRRSFWEYRKVGKQPKPATETPVTPGIAAF